MLAPLRELLTRLWTWREPTPRQIGMASAGGEGQVSQAMPPRIAMRTMVRHPYVWACVNRISSDLAGLPLKAVALGPDGTETRAELPRELVQRPNSAQSQREWRAQLYADYLLTGNAYIWRQPGASFRLHPAKVSIRYNALGLPTGYLFDGTVEIAVQDVGHVSGLSWADDAQELFGESPVRALWDELEAAAAAKAHAALAAKRGRAEWLITAKESFDKNLAERVAQTWEDAARKGRGAIVIGDALEATPLSMTLRDLEYQVLQERTDHAILAAFEVPPSIVGIPAANYGTSKQDARRYWANLEPRAARFDAVLTDLYGIPGRLEIRHDFSRVETLQVAKTEQIEQAKLVTELGAKPYDALKWVGLDNPPMRPDTEPRATTLSPLSAEEPDEPQGVRTVAEVLAESRDRYARAVRLGEYDLRDVDTAALAPLLGEHDARDLAGLVYRSVCQLVERCRAEGTEPHVAGLGVYSAAFAARISEREAA